MIHGHSQAGLSPGFTGPIQKTPVSTSYLLGLAVVAFGMVLLPLCYLGMIVSVAMFVWWHLHTHIHAFSGEGTDPNIVKVVLYIAPGIAGVVMVISLIKPLFAKPVANPFPVTVEEKDEPVLFSFIRSICSCMGAPFPREIRLDCMANASAGLRRGWWSFFSKDLVLQIGVPLIAGLSQRQLAGVVAHELGHFAQGTGMRLTFVIRSINFWLARIVEERDTWDEKLDEWADDSHWMMEIVFKLAIGSVEVGRLFLRCLMKTGLAMSCYMSRQMELDADSYEAKIAGSDEFPRTIHRLRLLSVARRIAVEDAQYAWNHRKLPEDLPALIVWRADTLPVETRQEIDECAEKDVTQWHDTHPCDRERIGAALALMAPGVFQGDAPASALLSDFAASSRTATLHFFRHHLELPLDEATFRTTADISTDRQASTDASKHLLTFFGDAFSIHRLLPLPFKPAVSWMDASEAMKTEAPTQSERVRRFEELLFLELNQSVGLNVLDAKFPLSDPFRFGLQSSNPITGSATLAETRQQRLELESAMEPFEKAAADRLLNALLWLDAQPTRTPIQQERLAHLLQIQRRLASCHVEYATVKRSHTVIQVLRSQGRSQRDRSAMERHVTTHVGHCEMATQRVLQTLGQLPHPYLTGAPNLRGSLRVSRPLDDEITKATRGAEICEEVMIPLLKRVMGELCELALEAEENFKDSPPPLPASSAAPAQPASPRAPAGLGHLPPPSLS